MQSKVPELSANTTISELPRAESASLGMIMPVDTINQSTGEAETLGLTVELLLNLARAHGNEPPTGTPIPWLTPTTPTGYISENQEFDPLVFPELGLVFPSNKTPDIAGRVLKCTTSFAATGQHEAQAVLSHDHAAQFKGNPLSAHSHTMSHTHTQQRLTTFESTLTIDDRGWGRATVPASGWSRRRQVAGASGSGVGMRFNNTNVQTGAPSTGGSTGATSGGSPTGIVTVSAAGASENRVSSILCRYMFRSR